MPDTHCMNPSREQKIREVIRHSQPDLTVVLENIFDPLNISAVMRSCDAVGVREVFVVYTQQYLDRRGLKLGKKTSAGVFKWTDVYVFEDLEECFRRVRERYGRVLATRPPSPSTESQTLYDLDLTVPTALLFGNEDEGITPESLALADGYFSIPMVGFVESLNISVACAVSLFEARRQRASAGFYNDNQRLTPEQQEQLFSRWSEMLKGNGWQRRFATPINRESKAILPVFVERNEYTPKLHQKPLPLTNFEL